MAAPLLRRPVVLLGAVVLAVVGLAVFQPWKLVVDQTVDDAAPTVSAAAAPVSVGASARPAADPGEPVRLVVEPVEIARGELISHEHASSGSVVILQLPDGSRVLRLEDLDTSNGPVLKVWLTDAPVIEGRAGWYVFDDGEHVDLGELRGNIGSSNYPIPADVDLDVLTSTTIWCDRFSVSFAAAELVPTA